MSNTLNLEQPNELSSSCSDSEEQKDDVEQIEQPRKTRLQWSGFGKKKPKIVEEVCPFSNCGRKFVSPNELRTHIDRRHKAKEQPKEEIVVSTPIPNKSKIIDLGSNDKSSISSTKVSESIQIDTTSNTPAKAVSDKPN